MSYGHHEEALAGALTTLLVTGTVPDSQAARVAIPALRDRFRTGLLDRVRILGHGHLPVATGREQSVNFLGFNGLHHLTRILSATPFCLALKDAASPVEILTAPAPDRVAELWRQAAVAIWLGNHDLDSSGGQLSYRSQWSVLGGLARCVETLTVLDEQLEVAGLLTGHQRRDTDWDLRGRRAVLATIAREAAWNGQDPDLDRLAATTGRQVQLVRDIDTLGAAELRLADLIRPGHRGSTGYNPVREVPISAARPLLRAQARLCLDLAGLARRHPDLADRFTHRAELLRDVHDATARLHDLIPRPALPILLNQSIEIAHGTRHLLDWDTPDRGQLLDLDAASRATARECARSLTRQAVRGDALGRYDTNGDQDGLYPVAWSTSSRLPAACKRLLDHDTAQRRRWSEPERRNALALTLDRTPTARRCPPRGAAMPTIHPGAAGGWER